MASRHRDLGRLTELLALRSDVAAWKLILAGRRVHRLMRKYGYNPAQPRLPRGIPEGGQWTGGGGALDAPFRKPPIGSRVRVAQSGRGGRGNRPTVRTSRGPIEANPRQAVEAAIATMRANRAIGIVQRVNSRWSPTPSLHTTIEAEIA